MSLIDLIKVGEPMPQVVPNTTAPNLGNGSFDSAGIVRKDNDGFVFVPYQPNGINRCELETANFDVISSGFTGCLMTLWQEQDGKYYAGHVGTGSDGNCIAFWNDWKMNNDITLYSEFKPSDYIRPMPFEYAFSTCYALYSFGNTCEQFTAWVIVTAKRHNDPAIVVQRMML
jgi:hypothetical protein